MVKKQKPPTCTRCKALPAVFHRVYSGEYLCKRCFIATIEERVRRTISKYKMLEPDDRIAVAVSGGKDSLSLLYILYKIEQRFPHSEIVVVTVDEGIPGYSEEAPVLVEKHCRRLGIEFVKGSYKQMFGYGLWEVVEKAQLELGPCSFCGVLRRRALNLMAREVDADKLAVAHTLDDEVQTLLINVIHGNVLRNLVNKPIVVDPEKRLVPRIKPLCLVPERETTLYAYLSNIEFQERDCPYATTALRQDVRRMLNRLELKYPGMLFTIYRSFEKLRNVVRDALPQKQLTPCALCGEPCSGEICKVCEILNTIEG